MGNTLPSREYLSLFVLHILNPPSLAAHPTHSLQRAQEDGVLRHCASFQPTGPPRAIVLLYHHGRADVDLQRREHQALADTCRVRVLVWEYAGFGTLRGAESLSSFGTLTDEACTVLGAVCRTAATAKLPVFGIGSALGAGLLFHAYARTDGAERACVKGLLLHNMFTSISQWCWDTRPYLLRWTWLYERNFVDCTADARLVDDVKIRLVNIEGDDTDVPVTHAQKMHALLVSARPDKERTKFEYYPQHVKGGWTWALLQERAIVPWINKDVV